MKMLTEFEESTRCVATKSFQSPNDGEPSATASVALAARNQFFQERIVRRPGLRLSGSAIYIAYMHWCRRQKIAPLTQRRFGTKPPWEKRRVGGIVFYIGAALSEEALA